MLMAVCRCVLPQDSLLYLSYVVIHYEELMSSTCNFFSFLFALSFFVIHVNISDNIFVTQMCEDSVSPSVIYF